MNLIEKLDAAAKATHPGEWSAQAGHLEEGGQCAFGREHALSDEDTELDPQDEEEHRAEKDTEFITLASPEVVRKMIHVIRVATAIDAQGASDLRLRELRVALKQLEE